MKKISSIFIRDENVSATFANTYNNSLLATPSIPAHFDGWAFSTDGLLYKTFTNSDSQTVQFNSSGQQKVYLRGLRIINNEEILDDTVVEKNVTTTAGPAPVSNNPLSGTWTQIGDGIDGDAYDVSGNSVSMNSDGTIVAIGVPGNNDNGYDSGCVRVYKNVNGTWTQVGDDIGGEAASDESGHVISMNSDGTIVAIGAPMNNGGGTNSGHVRVYENVDGTWTQVGDDIDGEAALDESGESISLNSDGTIVAIGGYGNDGGGTNSGHVRVYENVDGTWTQVGDDIDGEAAYDQSGGYNSVSLNSDGTIVAIGANANDGGGTSSGHVRVYKNVNGTWTQVGDDIDGGSANDFSGFSVSINSDGTIVAIGSPGATSADGVSYVGHVRVHENVNGTWTQVGDDIDGEAAYDRSGWSISINSDGTVIAISAIMNDGGGTNSGHVRVYENVDGTWTQVGDDIDGEAANDRNGVSVSINSDGTIVAIGASFNNGGGTKSGRVRIFELI